MTKNNEKKITRKEIVSDIKEQILLSKDSKNDVEFEYQSLFEQFEDFVIEMKSQGLIYKDIREFIELFVETPKVTTVSHNIQYPTLTIPDLDVTEKTVVQEGKAGKYNIVITELYKEEISRTKVIEESTITEIVKVPMLSESIETKGNSTSDKGIGAGGISYVGESYDFTKTKNNKDLSVGIDINSSYKDNNIITAVFSDQRRPVTFVCEKYKNYLASLKGSLGFDPTDKNFNNTTTGAASNFYRKTLNFTISVVQKLKEFGVTRVYLGKSGCMTLNTGNHFMVSIYTQLITACSIHSLEVVVVDEHRTSLADSIANDDFDKGHFSGERSKSNVHNYKSGIGVVVDADVNAAYNILRKGTQGSFKVSPELIGVSFNKKTVQLPEVNYMWFF